MTEEELMHLVELVSMASPDEMQEVGERLVKRGREELERGELVDELARLMEADEGDQTDSKPSQ